MTRTNRLEAALRRIAFDLDAQLKPWALIGGLAVSARAEPRTTRDVDVAVTVADDQEAERLVFELRQLGYDLVTLIEQRTAERLATVRLHAPLDGLRKPLVDLLFASSGIEREVVSGATRIEVLPGLVIPVASVAHLIAMKVLARDDRHRPQDYDDLRALFAVARDTDVVEARTALELIETRGHGRGRSLVTALEKALLDTQT